MKPIRCLATISAFALALTAVVHPAAIANPVSEDDIADSRARERATAGDIAALEIELAQIQTQTEQTGVAAQEAAEAYLRADEERLAAEQRAKDAAAAASAALQEVETARDKLGVSARDMYRRGSVPFTQLSPYVSDHTFHELSTAMTTRKLVTNARDGALQEFRGVETVAATLARQAEQARSEAEAAAKAANARNVQAQEAFDKADSQEHAAAMRRDELIAELARQRNTTEALERERQADLERARKERESEAALAQLQAQLAAQPAQPPSRDTPRPAPAPTSAPKPPA
ncbi:MAG: hypothetical protein Q4Q03_01945, partial [Bowdeniella nasicola]|nr:hypothetical protein [Bowdeniella nasicola]